ncbi:MAG: RidA family protein [Candidatus Dormibacteraeota bacterium]|nr:RidA family protein [Candidatus Dormibacteraeota bacterium]
MALHRLNPEGLFQSQAYSQVVLATGTRLVFIAGQVAVDGSGQVAPDGNFADQAKQAFLNVGRALAAAGARPADVTKLTIYVAGYSPEYLPAIGEARRAVFADTLPASTLVGVQSLAQPEFMIEVEATAVLD